MKAARITLTVLQELGSLVLVLGTIAAFGAAFEALLRPVLNP